MNEDYSEYKLIAEFTAKDFQAVLNNAVKDGWVRAEPMNLATSQHHTIYSQLMGMPYDTSTQSR